MESKDLPNSFMTYYYAAANYNYQFGNNFSLINLIFFQTAARCKIWYAFFDLKQMLDSTFDQNLDLRALEILNQDFVLLKADDAQAS